MNIKNFIEAFDQLHSASCRDVCECGQEFYNPCENYDFEEGEIESLEKNGAISVNEGVWIVSFEGKNFVTACGCWLDRASKIMGFLDSHDSFIATYLMLEKKRKINEADLVPDL